MATLLCWAALAFELVIWMLLRSGDSAVLTTPMLYGPRWVWLLPPLVLLPRAFKRPSRLRALSAAVIAALVPIMQLEINVSRRRPRWLGASPSSRSTPIRCVTSAV